ncbi:hypothetical protein [Jiulongibacter sediminis]|uniref:Uncharacterized protein n=1 Tax=Jiulongibacter sediminis TaxID=1605367 RepID=A0A0P7C6E1_9BACT|nr:hypothetical protein [Jiulongibacter sediminis]KPM48949.1 hypothetical protein AFM12_10390 [Jiulongibacter sediminis]TBX25475.1 hypothetical protein TK44_10395 [Jiulongibacter sediminis]
MMNYEINSTYLSVHYGENPAALQKAFDSFLNNTRLNWVEVAQLMEHGQKSKAVEKLNALQPAVKKVGFTELAGKITQFSQAIRMNLLGPEATQIRYETIDSEIAAARSRVKTELSCLL